MSSAKHVNLPIDPIQCANTPHSHKSIHQTPITSEQSIIVDQQTPNFKCSSFSEPMSKAEHGLIQAKFGCRVQHQVQLKTIYSDGYDEDCYPQITNNLLINSTDSHRFCYRVWGKHHILKNVTDFAQLFMRIKQSSNVQGMALDLSNKIPRKYKGAIINIYDEDQHKLNHALSLLLEYFSNIQQLVMPNEQQPWLSIIMPEMLVPVVMGKEGRLISKIKSITGSNVTVRGPYADYCYQNVQITSHCYTNIVNTCYLIYNTAYKMLKSTPIHVPLSQDRSHLKIGIIGPTNLSNILCNSNINVSIQTDGQYHNGYSTKWVIEGSLQDVKHVLDCAVLQVCGYGHEHEDIELIMTTNQAKYLTSYYGKFLRDISIKSDDCYLEIIAKQGLQSKFIITGSLEGKRRAVCLVAQFLCFTNLILHQQKSVKPINYQQQLDSLAQSQLSGGQSQWRVRKHKKKRKTKNIHKNTKRTMQHFHESKDSQRFKSTMAQQMEANF